MVTLLWERLKIFLKLKMPNERGIIPVGFVHCSKSLKKIIQENEFSKLNCFNQKLYRNYS